MDSEIKKLREQNDHLRKVIAFQENNTESIFKQLSENIDEVFWIRTVNEVIYINPAFEKVWGISCEEIYQDPQIFIETIHPGDKERIAEIFKSDSFNKNSFLEYEYRIIRLDKHIRWIHAKSMPVLNDEGEVIRRVGVAYDITEYKKSLEEKSLLAEMLDIAPNAITVHNLKGEILYANQKTFEIHGYSKEEYSALDLKTLDVTSSIDLIEKQIKFIEDNGHAIFEVKHILKDRSILPLEVYVKLVDWKGITALLSIATDTLERKKTEQALKESEEKFRNFVENANDIIYQLNPEGEFTYVSPNITEILGYQQNEIIGEKIEKFIHPDDLSSCIDFLYKVLTTGKKQSGIDYRVKHKNGTWQWHNSTGAPLKDKNGNIVSSLGISRDITEKTQAQKKLLMSETKFKAAFCTSPDSVNINKFSGEYVEINDGFTRLTGYTAEDVIGKLSSDISIWVIPEDRVTFVNELKSNGIIENLESVFRAKNGTFIPALISAKIIEINNEPHILSVTHDITDRKKFEQQIIEQNEEYETLNEELRQTNDELVFARQIAEESDRLKSTFLANMSHEIRTPMNGILGFADLLKEPDLSGEKQQEYIKIIEKSGKRMLNLINEIIDISKIESGLMELVVKETNINELIEEISTFFKPEADAKGIELSINIPTFQKKVILKTDHDKVFTILTNLVKNAIKYTSAGSIEIGYKLKTEHKPTKLEFYIKDTGIGIPKDRHKAIFDRFIQADIADKMAYQGAGLGLSISKAYVEMLGGKIWVESKEGHGSVFYFTLPFNTEPSEETNNQKNSLSGKNDEIRKLKILIAEDDEISAMVIENYLQVYSKETLKASSGIEAIEICLENPDIDLIMMDIRMTGMGGYEATKQIRTFNKKVIIIAQTAYALSGDKEKSIDAGCNDYIKKPVNRTELVGLVKKYFGK